MWIWPLPGALVTVSLATATLPPQDDAVDFRRDVRPILSEHCFTCHGPDKAVRKGKLRLDLAETAFAPGSGQPVIVPGDPEASELVYRIKTDQPGDHMPPPEEEKQLTEEQIRTLERWIAQGARWEEHWSFVTPTRPTPPADGSGWSRNPIDGFIARGWSRAGLSAGQETEPAKLLRRATYDLTGLPPTPAELDSFLADSSEHAYELQLERLLASRRFGEHWARPWLDAARYADTHGLHLDNRRSMWPYRDWVVDALNANMPFDQFTIEQLAGDLLPDPTTAQLIASGFNRCNPTSAEGGMIADEYLALYGKDRVDTTSTVWLGLTMGCAQCHDHKYDPLTQRDYYSLYAFFNSLDEDASDGNKENPKPFLRTPSMAAQSELALLKETAKTLEAELAAPDPVIDAAQALWIETWRQKLAERWLAEPPSETRAREGTQLSTLDDGSVLASGPNPAQEVFEFDYRLPPLEAGAGWTAIRLDAMCDASISATLPGRATNNNFVLSGVELECWPLDGSARETIVPAVVEATFSQLNWPITATLDGQQSTGWGGLGRGGDRSAVFRCAEPFGYPGGTGVTVRLEYESAHAAHVIGRTRIAFADEPELLTVRIGDWRLSQVYGKELGRGSFAESYPPESALDVDAKDEGGAPIWTPQPGFVDGKVHLFAQDLGSRYLWRTIDTHAATRLRIGLGSDDAWRLWLNGELVEDANVARGVQLDQNFIDLDLEAGRNEVVFKITNFGGAFGFAWRVAAESEGGVPLEASLILADMDQDEDLDGELSQRLRSVYRERFSPEWRAKRDDLAAKKAAATALENGFPTTMISRQRATPRPAHILMRGAYDHPGEKVEAATPASLPKLLEEVPTDRLGLARWLVHRDNPLTARVTVNRLWQQLFGTGLVKTAEDFGAQGEWPSHPELLDWLAVEFVESGWDVQHMLRLMMTSATYRQSSQVTPAHLEHDPHNRLLARGPRYRLDAEEVRDTALFLSGLMVEELGGPGVKPYQPGGIWKAVGYTSSNTANFSRDSGSALWRRSLYTFWKRTAPPPSLVTFDAPSREACSVRRERTNTPLQALVLMNDIQYVEAARSFAERILREGGETDEERLAWAFRCATARTPTARELDVLRAAQRDLAAEFDSDREGAAQLVEVGEAPRDESLDVQQHAAWTALASLLMNLDETITQD